MQGLILPPVTMLLTAIGMVLLDIWMPLRLLWQPPLAYAGVPVIAAGIVIASWHARLFKRIGANIQTFGEPTRLTRAGLFGRTRNPMYLGFVLALAGLFVLLGSLSPLLGLLCYALLANFWYVPFEERAMLKRFGSEYTAYCREVRRWL